MTQQVVAPIDKASFVALKAGKSVILMRKKCRQLTDVGTHIAFHQYYQDAEKVDTVVKRCWRWWYIKLVPL